MSNRYLPWLLSGLDCFFYFVKAKDCLSSRIGISHRLILNTRLGAIHSDIVYVPTVIDNANMYVDHQLEGALIDSQNKESWLPFW